MTHEGRPGGSGAAPPSDQADDAAASSGTGARAAVLTVSDGVVAGTREDRSGEALVEALGHAGYSVVAHEAVADERDRVEAALRRLGGTARLVVTTGGTGLGPRDVTPEATAEVIDCEVPGLAEAMRAAGRASTPLADLSRGRTGAIGSTLVLNLPGNSRGALESFETVAPTLPHALELLAGHTVHGPQGENADLGVPATEPDTSAPRAGDASRTVTVRLFAAVAEALGPETEVELDVPTTAGAVRAALVEAHPETAGLVRRCRLAVNLELVGEDVPVDHDDEVALLPPFAGGSGSARAHVDVREPPLPLDEALRAITDSAAGAQVVFLGTVRDHSPGNEGVRWLEYTTYEPMARKVLAEIADETLGQWPSLRGVALVHAVGALELGTHTVLVATTAPHRQEAYAANRHALEELKQRAPVWKREVSDQGARWLGVDDTPR